MVNIIFPITEDDQKQKTLFDYLKKKKDIRLIVGVTESLKKTYKLAESDSQIFKVYADPSKKEEIINSLINFAKKDKTLIIRKAISAEEIDKFLASKTEITICKEKSRNGFCEFFYNLGRKMMKFLFGFIPYGGKNNAIMFGQELSDVLRSANNISYSTRVNRWKGYSISRVEIEGNGYKFEYNKPKTLSILCLWISLLVLSISGTVVYYCFLPVTFLNVFLFICLNLLFSVAMIVAITIAIMNISAGERYYGYAKEIILKKEKNKWKQTRK